MQTVPPQWWLKQVCPVCKQGASLALVSCPKCGHIAIVCDEGEGTAFADARRISAAERVDERKTLCPICARVVLAEFSPATSDQLLAAGFTKDDYC